MDWNLIGLGCVLIGLVAVWLAYRTKVLGLDLKDWRNDR
jgi:hypothetical protein|tara:strand:+ start:125 stop:241 length:117 start_codon:yes stop_codon:yes gene_type:complete